MLMFGSRCEHCKQAKPEFEKEADQMKAEGIQGILDAFDTVKETEIVKRFVVTGFPTFIYFANGAADRTYNMGRTKDDFVKFMKDPTGIKMIGILSVIGTIPYDNMLCISQLLLIPSYP